MLLRTLALLLALGAAPLPALAVAIPVQAGFNSVSGGAGAEAWPVMEGEAMTIETRPDGQWTSGTAHPPTGAEGLAGAPFTFGGFTAPLGALVGEIAGLFQRLGSSFAGPAWATGPLRLFHWGEAEEGVGGTIEVLLRLESATPGVIPPAATPTPAPGAAPLLAAGLLGLAALRRRRGQSGASVRRHSAATPPNIAAA
jgi:MYXO-CTERM domain-containing protein